MLSINFSNNVVMAYKSKHIYLDLLLHNMVKLRFYTVVEKVKSKPTMGEIIYHCQAYLFYITHILSYYLQLLDPKRFYACFSPIFQFCACFWNKYNYSLFRRRTRFKNFKNRTLYHIKISLD